MGTLTFGVVYVSESPLTEEIATITPRSRKEIQLISIGKAKTEVSLWWAKNMMDPEWRAFLEKKQVIHLPFDMAVSTDDIECECQDDEFKNCRIHDREYRFSE